MLAMGDAPDQPRLAPLAPEALSDEQLALLDGAGGAESLNIFRTLVRAPGLYRRWAPFGGKLLRGGKLAERDRELVILRTAWRCRATYEWGQHVAIARAAGLDDHEIEAVADGSTGRDPNLDPGPDPDQWSAEDAALLAAVDQLVVDHRIDQATWLALRARFDDEQLIELTVLAGHYAMLAGALNSFGTELEDDQPGLGQVGP
jgi:4-carboxymuconolactone decarboxylase